jgi:NAD(P)-dependent dehydrogenase (short-subunit alcohol dehydrogenase family)
MKNHNKVALVTGGSRGIGFGIAKSLALEGINLAICGVRSEGKVAQAIKELKEYGVDVLYIKTDISKKEDRIRLIKKINGHFKRIDILVNNAGVAPLIREDILKASEKSFERLMKINLQGPYFLTQLVANQMILAPKISTARPMRKEKTLGCIINISSVSARVASINRGEYCISKAGVSMATKLWATRLAEYKIPVYEIQPGIIKTDMTKPVEKKYDALFKKGLLLQTRWGLPEDVGKAVAMIVRGNIAYSTGAVITVDGGLTTRRM